MYRIRFLLIEEDLIYKALQNYGKIQVKSKQNTHFVDCHCDLLISKPKFDPTYYMKKIESIENLVIFIKKANKDNKSIGLVPTMGALHQGHLALVQQAKVENDLVVCSIFVNPLQFNNVEDLKKYPNKIEEDIALLESVDCDLLFSPTNEVIYKEHQLRNFDFEILETVMEGVERPGHFNGVGNVIYRLFELVQPNSAYFGEKDFQQVAIVRKLSQDYFKKVKVISCKTVRSKDGLALSSRNLRLNKKQQDEAISIYKSMIFCVNNKAYFSPKELVKKAKEYFNEEFTLEYFIIADEQSLQPINEWSETRAPRVFVAVHIGGVRLIDNLSLNS